MNIDTAAGARRGVIRGGGGAASRTYRTYISHPTLHSDYGTRVTGISLVRGALRAPTVKGYMGYRAVAVHVMCTLQREWVQQGCRVVCNRYVTPRLGAERPGGAGCRVVCNIYGTTAARATSEMSAGVGKGVRRKAGGAASRRYRKYLLHPTLHSEYGTRVAGISLVRDALRAPTRGPRVRQTVLHV